MKRLPAASDPEDLHSYCRLFSCVLTLLSFFVLIGACSESSTEPNTDSEPSELNLIALFAAPTEAEISAVMDNWASRDISASGIEVADSSYTPLIAGGAKIRVVSHLVGDARHFGAIISPVGADSASLPILVYTHGGDDGVDVDELFQVTAGLDSLANKFVFVVPSFRAEELRFQGSTFASTGEASPWDLDVDDALSLINVTLELEPAADSTRVGVLGFSRGGGVGLLMAVRDPRIDQVIEFFGPTDFFDDYVQNVVKEALAGQLRDLPGLLTLSEKFLQPFKDGVLGVSEVRPELIRRSSVLFVSSLPDVQIHHGTADSVVYVSQAESLIDALSGIGREAPGFESYLYTGGTHDPLTLFGSIERAREFAARLVTPVSR